jgi:hypothetical protein
MKSGIVFIRFFFIIFATKFYNQYFSKRNEGIIYSSGNYAIPSRNGNVAYLPEPAAGDTGAG